MEKINKIYIVGENRNPDDGNDSDYYPDGFDEIYGCFTDKELAEKFNKIHKATIKEYDLNPTTVNGYSLNHKGWEVEMNNKQEITSIKDYSLKYINDNKNTYILSDDKGNLSYRFYVVSITKDEAINKVNELKQKLIDNKEWFTTLEEKDLFEHPDCSDLIAFKNKLMLNK